MYRYGLAIGSPMRFSMRVAGSPGAAQHAQHGAAVVAPPQRRLRRQRVGPEAAVGVDRAACHSVAMPRGVRQQAGQPGVPVSDKVARASRPSCPRRRASRMKALRRRGAVHQRLVQVPAAGHDVGKRRPAHEAGVVAGAAQRLAHAVAEQHHAVGRGQASVASNTASNWLGRVRSPASAAAGPALARCARTMRQRLVRPVGQALGQQVVAGWSSCTAAARPARRPRGPAVVGDAVDVELDLQPADAARKPASRQPRQRGLQHAARVRRHRRAVGVHQGSARSQAVPGAQGSRREAGRVGQQQQVAAPAKARQPFACAPGSKTLKAVRSEVSLSSSVLTMPTPVAARSAAPAAAAGISVLPRSMPCRSHQPMRTCSTPCASRRRCSGGLTRAPHARAASCTPQRSARLMRRPGPAASATGQAAARARGSRLARTAWRQWPPSPSAGAMQSMVSGRCGRGRIGPRRVPPAARSRWPCQQHAPVGHDHLVAGAQVLARAVLDGAHALQAHWSCTLMSSSPMPR
jgi:hypothetical protein